MIIIYDYRTHYYLPDYKVSPEGNSLSKNEVAMICWNGFSFGLFVQLSPETYVQTDMKAKISNVNYTSQAGPLKGKNGATQSSYVKDHTFDCVQQ